MPTYFTILLLKAISATLGSFCCLCLTKEPTNESLASSKSGLLRWVVAPLLGDRLLDRPGVHLGLRADLLGKSSHENCTNCSDFLGKTLRIVGKNQNLWHVDAFLHWGELRHQFRDMFACRVKGMVNRLKEMVNVFVFP